MDIFQIAAIGIIGAVLAIAVKRDAPIFAVMISLAVTVLIFLLILPQLAAVIALIDGIGRHLGSGREYILAVIKIIGIAIVKLGKGSGCPIVSPSLLKPSLTCSIRSMFKSITAAGFISPWKRT